VRSLGHYVAELITAVVQGCLVMAVLAAVLSAGAYFVARGHLPTGVDLFFVITIVVLAGLVGALARLVWRLTHLRELAHAAGHVVSGTPHQRGD
jgi:hypothetical protein